MSSYNFLFGKLFVAPVLLLTLAAGYAGGFWVAYPLMIIAVLATVASIARRQDLYIPNDWSGPAFVSAFTLLALAFFINRDLVHIVNFLMFLLFAPICATLSRLASPRSAFWVATCANIGCGVGFLIACYQVFWLHMSRATAFGSDPIWSAQAGVIIAFIALLGLMTTNRPWRFIFVAGPVAMIAVVALSGSRGPFLALPPLLLIFLVLGTSRWWLNLIVAGISAALMIVLVSWFSPEGLQRISTLGMVVVDLLEKGQITENSGGERQLMYEGGIAAFRNSPWFGHGWENLLEAIKPYLPNGFDDFKSVHHHLHSDSLDFAVSGGVLGLLAYSLALLAPVLGTFRSERDSQYRFRRIAGIGLSVSYAIFGISYLTFGYEYHTTLYIFLAAIIIGFCRDKSSA